MILFVDQDAETVELFVFASRTLANAALVTARADAPGMVIAAAFDTPASEASTSSSPKYGWE